MSVLLGKMIYLNKWRKEIWAIFRLLSMMLYKDFLTVFSCSAMPSLTFHTVEEASTTLLPHGSQQLAFTVRFCYYSFIIYLVFCSKTKGPPTRLEWPPQINAISKCR